MDDTTWLDATAQAGLVRRGEVSPAELTAAATARIEAVSPKRLRPRAAARPGLPGLRARGLGLEASEPPAFLSRLDAA